MNFTFVRRDKNLVKVTVLLFSIFVLFACDKDTLESGELTFDLNGEWSVSSTDNEYACLGQVPGYAYLDLIRNNLIEDPYVGLNEQKNQGLEHKNWVYTKKFHWDTSQSLDMTELVFKGIDTYATIFLNGKEIGQTTNMFRSFSFDINDNLLNGENVIKVVLHSPFKAKKEQVENLGYVLPADSEVGELKYSPFCRKAPYHFGWDWGPRIISAGIYKDVFIRSFSGVQMIDYQCQTLSISDDAAKMILRTTLRSTRNEKLTISLGDYLSITCEIKEGENYITDTFMIHSPEFWWPNGHGKANLYKETLSLEYSSGKRVFREIQFGIRTVELVSEADAIGTAYYFKINGTPIFAKGANYIPQDIFVSRVPDKNYRKLLGMAKEANMNMIRVWGGGVYERELFYELCDSLGLMVWQDFMFAGTMYPINDAFVSEVHKEIDYQINRLAKHPSLVHFCGNNELEVAWNNWGWQEKYGYSEEIQEELWTGYQRLFHDSIPAWINKGAPEVPYSTTSPLSNWGTPENFNHASMHYWGVWHGREDIESFADNVGRFMSEYGMQSYPSMRLLEAYAGGMEIDMETPFINGRQKSYIGNGELMRHILKNHKKPKDFEEFVDRTQDIQARGMEIAIRAHTNSDGHCMGSLLWQLNDCWPGASWSIIDYELNPKKAYFSVKEGFRREEK